MARTWNYTWRSRLALLALASVGRPASLIARAVDRRFTGTTGGVRSILVIEGWNIGDVVLAMPFLAEVRALFPGASVTLLGQPHAAEILRGSELVDEVIEARLPWTGVAPGNVRGWLGDGFPETVRTLRRHRFDIAFESRMDPRAKVLMALAGARRRVGYSYGGAGWLLTDAVAVADRERHKIEDWMGLLAPFGGPTGAGVPQLHVSPADAAWARTWLSSRGAGTDRPVVAVHAGASHETKRWPRERFAQVIQALVASDVQVVVISGPDGYGSELAGIGGVAGIQPGLRELIALLARCAVLVCNDSGPMHLAAAVGTPVVAVSHAHAAREFAPFGSGHHVLAPPPPATPVPLDKDGPSGSELLAIAVETVLASVTAVLEQRAAKSAG